MGPPLEMRIARDVLVPHMQAAGFRLATSIPSCPTIFLVFQVAPSTLSAS